MAGIIGCLITTPGPHGFWPRCSMYGLFTYMNGEKWPHSRGTCRYCTYSYTWSICVGFSRLRDDMNPVLSIIQLWRAFRNTFPSSCQNCPKSPPWTWNIERSATGGKDTFGLFFIKFGRMIQYDQNMLKQGTDEQGVLLCDLSIYIES